MPEHWRLHSQGGCGLSESCSQYVQYCWIRTILFRVLEYKSNIYICRLQVFRWRHFLHLILWFSRRLSKSIGNQVYLPKRFLAGILPTSLVVDKYSFWQSEIDDIIGNEEFESADDDEEELINEKRSSTSQVWFEGYPTSILTPQLKIKIWIFQWWRFWTSLQHHRRLYSNVQVCLLLG